MAALKSVTLWRIFQPQIVKRLCPTRSHPELGRETSQRRWYYRLSVGRVGRRQALKLVLEEKKPIHMFLAGRPHPAGQYVDAGWSSPVARQAHNLKLYYMHKTHPLTWPTPTDAAELADVMFDAVRNGPSKYTDAQRAAWVPERKRGVEWELRLAAKDIIIGRDGGRIVGFMSIEGGGYIDFAFIRPD
eukprot:gene36879-48104_t